MKTLLSLVMSCLGALTLAQTTPTPFVEAGDKAYMPMPPKFVVEGEVQRMVWSADGKKLLVLRNVMPIDAKGLAAMIKDPKTATNAKPYSEIGIWSTETRVFLSVAKVPAVFDAHWFRGGVLFQVYDQQAFKYTVYWGQAGKAPRELLSAPSGITYAVSPNGQHAMLLQNDTANHAHSIVFLGEGGAPSAPIALKVGPEMGRLNDDGTGGFAASEPGAVSKWRSVDATRRTVSEATPTFAEPSGSTLPFHIIEIEAKLDADASAKTLWMQVGNGKAPFSTALLCGDSDQGEVNRDGTWIAYRSGGLALVREIAHLDAAAVHRLKALAAQQKAMNEAKQAALAALIYANDHDDAMVGGADWADKLLPYVRNRGILANFTLLMNGGSLAGLQDPSSVQLGFVNTPYGRAVAFADGHVRWFANP